ncbi:MAG TPA: UvrB/UvrC motif-containing protein, partial [Thermoanaerobaculia bacterium]|nr:UvrB/UvrC motif-containing protein [Thermoanaerobaculia bacterium]
VLVGLNRLGEGLCLPGVSLVGILDADKEGFLRSETSLIQTAGRAARNVKGVAVFYADQLTDSIRRAVAETERRRAAQAAFNEANGIVPESIVKAVDSPLLAMANLDYLEPQKPGARKLPKSPAALEAEIGDLEKQMKEAARALEFETAASLRDRIRELRALRLFG